MTVDVFELAILLILTLMLGILIPMGLELRRFARSARKRVESSGPKIDRLVEDAQVSATELKKVAEVFRGKDDQLKRLSESISQTVEAFEKVEKGLRVGSAVGAAVAPAIATFLASMTDEQAAARERHAAQEDVAPRPHPLEGHHPTHNQAPQN